MLSVFPRTKMPRDRISLVGTPEIILVDMPTMTMMRMRTKRLRTKPSKARILLEVLRIQKMLRESINKMKMKKRMKKVRRNRTRGRSLWLQLSRINMKYLRFNR